MQRIVGLALLVVLATGLAGCTIAIDGDTPPGPGTDASFNVTVTHVVDGDTVDVRYANGSTERVRLLGIDTPEVHVETEPDHFEGVPDTEAGRECLRATGHNATAFLEAALDDGRARIRLDGDGEARGDYGRLLAYLFVGAENLNYRLVVTGHATVYPTSFDQRERFEAARSEARAADRGVWRCRDAGS